MSPRSAADNRALRSERRTQIVQSALQLFARHGYAQTSVRMIAQQAGISQGLMYRYFASKEDLLRAVAALFLDQVHDLLTNAAASTSDPATHLARIIRDSFAVLRQQSASWKLFYVVRIQPEVAAGLRDDTVAWKTLVLDQLEAPFRAAGMADPRAEAALLFAIIDGIGQNYTLDPASYPLDAVLDRVLARYADLSA
jgi:AcrR family transcriptional regulator